MISELPKAKKVKAQKKVEKGVVYLGRIPHGFYEEEMTGYFSQFGNVTRLRLSRNKKTGKSKHYAFIEFESLEVAKIVAETMDNYLLSNHVLKCSVVEKVHEDLFKGAGKKFKKIPQNKLQRLRRDKERTKEEQEVYEKGLLEKDEKKRQELKELGIDYDFPGHVAKKRTGDGQVSSPVKKQKVKEAQVVEKEGRKGPARQAKEVVEPKEVKAKTAKKEKVEEPVKAKETPKTKKAAVEKVEETFKAKETPKTKKAAAEKVEEPVKTKEATPKTRKAAAAKVEEPVKAKETPKTKKAAAKAEEPVKVKETPKTRKAADKIEEPVKVSKATPKKTPVKAAATPKKATPKSTPKSAAKGKVSKKTK
jgi:nucleolar protein 15